MTLLLNLEYSSIPIASAKSFTLCFLLAAARCIL